MKLVLNKFGVKELTTPVTTAGLQESDAENMGQKTTSISKAHDLLLNILEIFLFFVCFGLDFDAVAA